MVVLTDLRDLDLLLLSVYRSIVEVLGMVLEEVNKVLAKPRMEILSHDVVVWFGLANASTRDVTHHEIELLVICHGRSATFDTFKVYDVFFS